MTRPWLDNDSARKLSYNSVLKNSTHINGGPMDQDHTYADTGERGPLFYSPENLNFLEIFISQSNIALAGHFYEQKE